MSCAQVCVCMMSPWVCVCVCVCVCVWWANDEKGRVFVFVSMHAVTSQMYKNLNYDVHETVTQHERDPRWKNSCKTLSVNCEYSCVNLLFVELSKFKKWEANISWVLFSSMSQRAKDSDLHQYILQYWNEKLFDSNFLTSFRNYCTEI